MRAAETLTEKLSLSKEVFYPVRERRRINQSFGNFVMDAHLDCQTVMLRMIGRLGKRSKNKKTILSESVSGSPIELFWTTNGFKIQNCETESGKREQEGR